MPRNIPAKTSWCNGRTTYQYISPQRPTGSKMAVCRMIEPPPSPVNSNSSDAPLKGLRAPGNAAYREAFGFEQPEMPPADMSGGTCKEDSCFHFRWFASSRSGLRTATISQNVNWFRTKPPLRMVQPSRLHCLLQLSMPRHALESQVFGFHVHGLVDAIQP
jgi:hypothetical protein